MSFCCKSLNKPLIFKFFRHSVEVFCFEYVTSLILMWFVYEISLKVDFYKISEIMLKKLIYMYNTGEENKALWGRLIVKK